ncbi:MAG TPA: DUF262 domain-containing protein [Archangium sp.]|uniref:DUF262 domain-containing protein n=1 Tax=Archangium sp. TaxID=1872627 RepID=UPI002E330933|nr:DUF262 domain-containing protein [Archangium sp.]HEX5750455.1 DUF262 domain-containing protein [Archangium sp.]
MSFQPQTYTVDKIVSWINTGRLALPDFQRRFVWTPSKVADLIDSVSRGWPIGSLLLLDGPQPFKPRPIENAPPLRGNVEVFVLDGQQRVTALFHAVADVSDVVYYIDFNALEHGDEYVKWQERASFEAAYPTVTDQAARRIAKVSVVFDEPSFHEWQRHLPHDVGSLMVSLRDRNLPGLRANVYKFIGVALEQDIALEALARIFETTNRTGVRLNAFDLMIAVLYPQKFNLWEEWENARAEHELLGNFEVDGIEILKLIALWERREQQNSGKRLTVKGVRQGDVLAVEASRVRALWPRAVDAYDAALEYGRRKFGLVDAKSVPSSAMILTLAFMLDGKFAISAVDNWYWSSIASQSYAQGANTRVVSDVDRVASGSWSRYHGAPEQEETLKLALMEPVRRNRLLTRGVGCLLASRGALDPLTKQPLKGVKELQFISRTALHNQLANANADTPIVDQIFMDATSAKRVRVAMRKGRSFSSVLDQNALAQQGFAQQTVSPDADQLDRRAGIVARWLVDAATGTGDAP